MIFTLFPRKSVAQYEIYGYEDYKKSGLVGKWDVELRLPRTIVLKDTTVRPHDSYKKWLQSRDNVQRRLKDNMPDHTRRYTWLYNPGCWVEEVELKEILDSHEQGWLDNFNPDTDKRIWKIYDALDVDSVIQLIAESFCNRYNKPGLGGIPAMRKYDIAMLKKAFADQKCPGFPCLHHMYITRPNNPTVMPEWMYKPEQLLVDIYHI